MHVTYGAYNAITPWKLTAARDSGPLSRGSAVITPTQPDTRAAHVSLSRASFEELRCKCHAWDLRVSQLGATDRMGHHDALVDEVGCLEHQTSLETWDILGHPAPCPWRRLLEPLRLLLSFKFFLLPPSSLSGPSRRGSSTCRGFGETLWREPSRRAATKRPPSSMATVFSKPSKMGP